MLITCGGCVIATDFYAGKRPYDYGKATWVCVSPDAWFVINASEGDKDYIYPKGEIAIDKESDKLFNGQYDTITFVRNAGAETTSQTP